MDAKTHSALELGWRLVAATLERLAVLAGRGWLLGPVWARAFAELRRAEGVARRMLVVLAAGVTVEAASRREDRMKSTNPASNTPKTPGFALFDPLPELNFSAPCDGAPDWAAEPVPHTTHGLAARLAALSALAENPAPAVRRMTLWLARRKRGRTTPLRPGAPPGTSGSQWLEREADVAWQCDGRARDALNGAGQSP